MKVPLIKTWHTLAEVVKHNKYLLKNTRKRIHQHLKTKCGLRCSHIHLIHQSQTNITVGCEFDIKKTKLSSVVQLFTGWTNTGCVDFFNHSFSDKIKSPFEVFTVRIRFRSLLAWRMRRRAHVLCIASWEMLHECRGPFPLYWTKRRFSHGNGGR